MARYFYTVSDNTASVHMIRLNADETFTEMPNLGQLPYTPTTAYNADDISVSPTGTYMAYAYYSAMQIAKWNSATETWSNCTLTQPNTSVGYISFAWSLDEQYLCTFYSYNSAYYITMMKKTGPTTFGVVGHITGWTMPSYASLGGGFFSKDGNYLFVRHNNSTDYAAVLMVFKRTAGTDNFVYLKSYSHGNGVNGAQKGFKASADDKYILSPVGWDLRIIARDGENFSTLQTIVCPVSGANIVCAEISPDNTHIVVSAQRGTAGSSPVLYVYKKDANQTTWTLLGSNFDFQPTHTTSNYAIYGMGYSDDGLYLYCVGKTDQGGGGIFVYRRIGDNYVRITGHSTAFSMISRASVASFKPVSNALYFRPITGHVYDQNGNPVARKVRCYNRVTGNLVDETTSSAVDGSFGLGAARAQEYQVVVMDDTKNAMIYDHVIPTV